MYCCGQPTKQGYENVLNEVTKSYPKEGPIILINMRQEPSVYVNGQPVVVRSRVQDGDQVSIGGTEFRYQESMQA